MIKITIFYKRKDFKIKYIKIATNNLSGLVSFRSWSLKYFFKKKVLIFFEKVRLVLIIILSLRLALMTLKYKNKTFFITLTPLEFIMFLNYVIYD